MDLSEGQAPVSPSGPSEAPYQGRAYTKNGWVPISPNRALRVEEIEESLKNTAGARNERKWLVLMAWRFTVPMDICLINSCKTAVTNERMRTGAIENRARLLLEVTAAVISTWGNGLVGVRLGPNSIFNGMSDSNPDGTFAYAADELRKLGIAYLHLIGPRIDGNIATNDGLPPVAAARLKKVFKGTVIAAGGSEPDTAEEIIEKGDADLVAFGRHFISILICLVASNLASPSVLTIAIRSMAEMLRVIPTIHFTKI